jgi:osmotically-inducible protein OsmY
LLRVSSLLVAFCLFAGSLFAAQKDLTDDVIYDQVRVKLAADREVGGAGIDVKVTDGVVELRGNVKKDQIRGKAEKIAKRVKGVKSVVNNLQVATAGGPPPGTNK